MPRSNFRLLADGKIASTLKTFGSNEQSFANQSLPFVRNGAFISATARRVESEHLLVNGRQQSHAPRWRGSAKFEIRQNRLRNNGWMKSGVDVNSAAIQTVIERE